jgi:hypothetical protein
MARTLVNRIQASALAFKDVEKVMGPSLVLLDEKKGQPEDGVRDDQDAQDPWLVGDPDIAFGYQKRGRHAHEEASQEK